MHALGDWSITYGARWQISDCDCVGGGEEGQNDGGGCELHDDWIELSFRIHF
jgi:hypothetical protein